MAFGRKRTIERRESDMDSVEAFLGANGPSNATEIFLGIVAINAKFNTGRAYKAVAGCVHDRKTVIRLDFTPPGFSDLLPPEFSASWCAEVEKYPVSLYMLKYHGDEYADTDPLIPSIALLGTASVDQVKPS